MLFNSLQYLVFFPLAVLLYYIVPFRFSDVLILALSYFFYMSWVPECALLMLVSTAVTFAAGLLIDSAKTKGRRKLWLVIDIAVNLGILFFFKYFNFFSDSIAAVGGVLGFHYQPYHTDLLLPIGISFYTFQALGYTFDVYNGTIRHTKNFFRYAAFVSFFPQIFAGPIGRAPSLLPQFEQKHRFLYRNFVEGFQLILIGMFKKVVLADFIAMYVNHVFTYPHDFRGLTLLTASALFAVQLYCDFSGYSDIAKGSARVMGFQLMDNFTAPYFAKSISEFWSRWHISLSTWFRDYLYIPLGGNRRGFARKLLNLFIVFAVSGLWHGAKWTFVVWGLIHAVLRIGEELARKVKKPGVYRGAAKLFVDTGKWLATFSAAAFAFIFFVSRSIEDAFYVIRNMFRGLSLEQFKTDYIGIMNSIITSWTFFKSFWLAVVVGGMLFLFFYDARIAGFHCEALANPLSHMRRPARWSIYYALAALIIVCFAIATRGFGLMGQFIYLQF